MKTTKEFLNEMAKEYDLTKDETFTKEFKNGDEFTIITRAGIEKIQAKAGIKITYGLADVGSAGVIIQAYGTKDNDTIETFGSASKDTSQSKYYAEMAEKRAMSRVVLKLIDAYKYNVMGEDEADEFKKQ